MLDAADLRDQRVIDEFRSCFASLEGQYELRTEPWAPDALASDEPSMKRCGTFGSGPWLCPVTPMPNARELPVAVPTEDDR